MPAFLYNASRTKHYLQRIAYKHIARGRFGISRLFSAFSRRNPVEMPPKFGGSPPLFFEGECFILKEEAIAVISYRKTAGRGSFFLLCAVFFVHKDGQNRYCRKKGKTLKGGKRRTLSEGGTFLYAGRTTAESLPEDPFFSEISLPHALPLFSKEVRRLCAARPAENGIVCVGVT